MANGAIQLKEGLPTFYAEIAGSLHVADLGELLQQLPDLWIVSRCLCPDLRCATFGVASLAGRSALDTGGSRCAFSHVLPARAGLVMIDLDHRRRIVGFQVQDRCDVAAALHRLGFGKAM